MPFETEYDIAPVPDPPLVVNEMVVPNVPLVVLIDKELWEAFAKVIVVWLDSTGS